MIIPRTESGYLSLMVSLNKISRKLIHNDRVLLLRIVFEMGSLGTAITNEQGTTLLTNCELACQFEIDMNNGKVSTYYSGYTYGVTGTKTWHPLSLACLVGNNLNVMGVPYAKWTILSTMDRTGLLNLKSDWKLEDVPLGIPAEFTYSSCNIPEDPIDENNYFGVVRMPYVVTNMFSGMQVPSPTLIEFDKIVVKSKVRQLFNINCDTCAYNTTDGTAIYIHPKLVYDPAGYVMLPIFFSNVDEVHIDLTYMRRSLVMDYTIDVDLGDLPKVDPEPDDTSPETPDIGDGEDNGDKDNNENIGNDGDKEETTTPPLTGETDDNKSESGNDNKDESEAPENTNNEETKVETEE